MIKASEHPRERERLKALYAYDILDTDPEREFDELTQLASIICGAPISLISLLDPDRQWFKSHYGLEATQTDRDIAFCAHAIQDDDLTIVPDTLKDKRFFDNPLVTDGPHIRFYAGAPLVTSNNLPLGTLCVIDSEPRELSQDQQAALRILAKQVMVQLELRRNLKRQQEYIQSLRKIRNDLRESTEREARANQSKTRFLASMSHEIRNPMNGIMGGLSVLEHTTLNDEQNQLVDVIKRSTKGLLTIINDILDYSKIESGRLHLESIGFCLRDLFDDVTRMFNTSAEERGLAFKVRIDPDCPLRWRGDPNRLRQILINLVGNALKFTEAGHVTLEARRGQYENKPQLELTVSDTGIGMSEDFQEKIFEDFTQAEPGTARRFGGTGLGLAIVRSLVDLMDGRIDLETRLGDGSTFQVKLPLLIESPIESQTYHGRDQDLPRFQKRILIVEDQRINRLVVRKMLEKLGCDVAEVNDGADAVEAISAGDYDLVLMDVHMPKLDGLKAAQYIQQLNRPQPPIIAMTGNAFPEDEARCRAVGMRGFLAKPVQLESLVLELSRWFDVEDK